MASIKIEVFLEEEQVEESFDNLEIKFTKNKLKELKKIINEQEIDIKEQLEERFLEVLEELIEDRWGE